MLFLILINYIASEKSNRYRSSRPEVFLGKGVLKICSKFTGEHSYRSVNLIKLLCDFIEITLLHGCSLVNLLHIFRKLFPKNTSGRLLLPIIRRFGKQQNRSYPKNCIYCLNNIVDPIMTLLVTCRNHPSIFTIRDYGKGRRNSTKQREKIY